MENRSETITIPVWRYENMLKKSLAYDAKVEELSRGGYVSDFDSIIFEVPKSEGKHCCKCGGDE